MTIFNFRRVFVPVVVLLACRVCAEDGTEIKAAFSRLIHSQTAESLVLVERTVAEFPDFINVDKFHEFRAPKVEFTELSLPDPQTLNADLVVAVRINCAAHRFPRTVKSKTAQTPADLPREIPMWKGEDPGKTWEQGPTSKERGSCDYIGIRKGGKWTFTISGFLMNPVWLEKVVLLPKSQSPKPEEELSASESQLKRPQAGIGALLEPVANVVEIKSLFAGGPAEKSGQLQIGDRIIAIGDDDPPKIWGKIDLLAAGPKDERDFQFSEVIKQIRGTIGTAVHLKIQPAGTTDPSEIRTVKIIRAELRAK